MSIELANKELQQVATQYRVEFHTTEETWAPNAMTFETREEAEQYGQDITRAQLSLFDKYRVVQNQPSA